MEHRLHITVDGRAVAMTAADAAGYIHGLDRQFDDHEQSKLALRLKMGAALLEVRPQYEHGTWQAWLGTTKVDARRVRSAMQLAAALAGPDGTPDLGKCIARGLVRPDQEDAKRRNGAVLDGTSLRQAEIAAGIRKGGAPVSAEQEVEEVEDESQYASDAELAALGYSGGDGGEEEDMEAVLVGDKDVKPGDVLLAGPERGTVVAAPKAAQGIAGRIGPVDLGKARRPDAEGQMTLVGCFVSALAGKEKRIEGLDAERRRRAEAVLMRCSRELDEILGEAA